MTGGHRHSTQVTDEMDHGLYLIGFTRHGLFDALSPETLSAAHPLWQADVERFGPWTKSAARDGEKPSGGPVWRPRNDIAETRILVCGRSSSTMDILRHLIETMGLEPWDSVLAVEQAAGRGQHRRKWLSFPGNLYASWYWPDLADIKGASPGWSFVASLLAGELVAAALEDFGVSPRIKWPNDLLIHDRKICGILTEQRNSRIIVGIGLNLAGAPSGEQLADPFSISASHLTALNVETTPLALWTRIAASGRQRLFRLLQQTTPKAFVEDLTQRLAWIGRDVTVRKSPEESFPAVIEGLAPDGGLVIRRRGKTEVIYTGSILPV